MVPSRSCDAPVLEGLPDLGCTGVRRRPCDVAIGPDEHRGVVRMRWRDGAEMVAVADAGSGDQDECAFPQGLVQPTTAGQCDIRSTPADDSGAARRLRVTDRDAGQRAGGPPGYRR